MDMCAHVVRHGDHEELAALSGPVHVVLVPRKVDVARAVRRAEARLWVVREDAAVRIKEVRCREVAPSCRPSVSELHQPRELCPGPRRGKMHPIGIYCRLHDLREVHNKLPRLT